MPSSAGTMSLQNHFPEDLNLQWCNIRYISIMHSTKGIQIEGISVVNSFYVNECQYRTMNTFLISALAFDVV
jgi:hypothetical protein